MKVNGVNLGNWLVLEKWGIEVLNEPAIKESVLVYPKRVCSGFYRMPLHTGKHLSGFRLLPWELELPVFYYLIWIKNMIRYFQICQQENTDWRTDER